jgi:hypothetical protein
MYLKMRRSNVPLCGNILHNIVNMSNWMYGLRELRAVTTDTDRPAGPFSETQGYLLRRNWDAGLEMPSSTTQLALDWMDELHC